MLDESLFSSTMNLTGSIVDAYSLWYLLNDFLMLTGNAIGIFVAILFIFTVIRVNHPTYSISNLIACNTSVSIALTSTMMLINACFALRSDLRGRGHSDSFCILRGTLLTACYMYMYASLCLKAFNRLRCIVYNNNPVLKSYRGLAVVFLTQWLVAIIIALIVVLTDGIVYDWNSHLCLITEAKPFHFVFTRRSFSQPVRHAHSRLFLVLVYYSSILFLSSVYFSILHYVAHLPLLERYRRKRQLGLLRRILFLLIMLIIPGSCSTFLVVRWIVYGSLPTYAFKVRTLFDTIGYTGAIMTIFISHTALRRQYYNGKKLRVNNSVLHKLRLDKCDLIVLQDRPRPNT